MRHPPSLDQITQKVTEVFSRELERPIPTGESLMAGLNLDSLDLIEASFSLEDHFDFEFSDKNPIDQLDRALGGGRLVHEGLLTELGLQVLLERMPELEGLGPNAGMSLQEVERYYTIETYARLIQEFYEAMPETCPESGELVVLDGFKMVGGQSGQPIAPPNGDDVIQRWVNSQLERLPS